MLYDRGRGNGGRDRCWGGNDYVPNLHLLVDGKDPFVAGFVTRLFLRRYFRFLGNLPYTASQDSVTDREDDQMRVVAISLVLSWLFLRLNRE